MIRKTYMPYIHKAIKIYDLFVGKTFLLAYHENRKHPFNFIEIKFEHNNFWHLVGCKIDKSLNFDNKIIYQDCLNGKDISQMLLYSDKEENISAKSETIEKVFDFINKGVRVTDKNCKNNSWSFDIALGDSCGFVGYDKESKSTYFPRTVQKRDIDDLKKKANKHIIIVLQKENSDIEYNRLAYEASHGLFSKLKPEQFKDYPLAPNLLAMLNGGGGGGNGNSQQKHNDKNKSAEKGVGETTTQTPAQQTAAPQETQNMQKQDSTQTNGVVQKAELESISVTEDGKAQVELRIVPNKFFLGKNNNVESVLKDENRYEGSMLWRIEMEQAGKYDYDTGKIIDVIEMEVSYIEEEPEEEQYERYNYESGIEDSRNDNFNDYDEREDR